MTKIKHSEWWLVLTLSLAVIIITSLPIAIGFFSTPQNNIFLGLQTINSNDTPVYYSWIEQAKEGRLLFKNLFTSEDEGRFIFDPFWLGVGLFAKLLSLSSFAAYQLARIFLIPIFLSVAYIFISHFFTEEKKRKLCFLFLIFSSGLGWIVGVFSGLFAVKFKMLPIDLWAPETFPFQSLYTSPHLIAALIIIISIFLLTFLAIERKKMSYSLGAGIAALFLFQFQPYHVPTIFGVLGIFLVILSIRNKHIRWDVVKHFFIIFIFSLPALLYQIWTLKNFWSRQQHALQNVLLMPNPLITVISYGLPLFLALIGIVYLLKKIKTDKEVFLIVWFFTQSILIYCPLNFQRRLTAGLGISIIILATYSFNLIEKKIPRINSVYFLIFLPFLGLSNFYLIMADLDYYSNPPKIYSPYITEAKNLSMRWLRYNTPPESIILSLPPSGNLIPAMSTRTVYLGHWGMTADANRKIENVRWFFETQKNNIRSAFLKINNIDYLFFGPEEKAAGNFDPGTANYLENVYQNSDVTIYKVKEE